MIDALKPYDSSLQEKLVLGRVIREIGRFALAKVDQVSNSVQVHRLVQAVIKAQLSEEEQREARHVVHRILAGARPDDDEPIDNPETWPRFSGERGRVCCPACRGAGRPVFPADPRRSTRCRPSVASTRLRTRASSARSPGQPGTVCPACAAVSMMTHQGRYGSGTATNCEGPGRLRRTSSPTAGRFTTPSGPEERIRTGRCRGDPPPTAGESPPGSQPAVGFRDPGRLGPGSALRIADHQRQVVGRFPGQPEHFGDVGHGAALGGGAQHVGLASGQRAGTAGQGLRGEGRIHEAQAGVDAADRVDQLFGESFTTYPAAPADSAER
ncbi:hypothetical protein SCALM49S_01405 [Streptomyces californicus]